MTKKIKRLNLDLALELELEFLMIRQGIPQAFIDKTYQSARNQHPKGCYGQWTWAKGSLKVRCQGCGYMMRINPATKELNHLESVEEAVEHMGAIREYGPY